jgi:hypothetical protein
MNIALPAEVRARIDAHLDAVEDQLRRAGEIREKRRGIVDDLETQILDMLDANDRPSLAAVDAVLCRLDPPQAYRGETNRTREPSLTSHGRGAELELCRQAKHGLWWLGGAFVAQIVVVLDFLVNGTPGPRNTVMDLAAIVAVFPAAIGPIVGTAMGWIATERIRRSNGTQIGLGLSVIEALSYPILTIWTGALIIWNVGVSYATESNTPEYQLHDVRVIGLFGVVATGIVLTVAIVLMLVYLTRERKKKMGMVEPPVERLLAAS